MPTINPFTGAEQGDVAFLELSGVAYRCYVWQRSTRRTISESTRSYGAGIEAAIYVEQADGESVLLGRWTVRTPASGFQTDCPRVVATLSQSFHVHWIEYDPTDSETLGGHGGTTSAGAEIHRSTFDLEDSPYAWDYQGAISTSYLHLYDTQSLDPSEDYILVHASLEDQISMYRVNGDAWIDNAWNVSVGSLTLAENVLAASANREAPMAIYQSGSSLQAFSRVWATGVAEEAPTTISSAWGDFTAVGACQRDGETTADVFIVAEYEDSTVLLDLATTINLPSVVSLEADATSLAVPAREPRTPNVTLQSKPWRSVSAQSISVATPQFFCVLGYQDGQADAEWLQSNHYVARFEAAASAGTGRPIVVATLASGIADARRHGATPAVSPLIGEPLTPTGPAPNKRRNHIPSATPAPTFGPLVKSHTTFLGRWSRIDTALVDSTALLGTTVAGAALESLRFHHDDAWGYPYDDADPPLPTVPYAATGVPQLESVHAGAGLFLSGGTPQTYDGHRFVEAGFPWRPEIIDARESSSGSLAAGNYQYSVVYEWRDNRGQTHRSEPSAPLLITTAGRSVELEIRCCNISTKDNAALGADENNPVKVDVFRTESGGTIFYPLFRGNDGLGRDLTNIPTNDPAALTVQVEDGFTDASIAEAVPLPFTQSNGAWTPIPGQTPPAMRAVATWQNRVVGVSSEDPGRLWISLEIRSEPRGEKYTIAEFSSDLTFRMDSLRGPIVAMAEMDSALVIFTERSIHSLVGSPADATGQGSTLQVQLLQRDTGCVEPRSIAPAPDGIYFQSRRGLYKLTRQNALEFVGADVEEEIRAAGSIRAITVHEASHQVRVLCGGAPYDSPQVLVYDWLMGMWASWPLPAASSTDGLSSPADALVWRGHAGEHAHVTLQAGGVHIQKANTSASRYADESGATATVAIPVDVRTGWIHLAGLAGFKRVREVGLHLTKPADGALTVELEYDLDGSQTDGSNIQTETIASPAPAYIQVRTSIQKCNAIRIRIYESTATPTGTALTASTLNLHAVTLSVARKPGTNRVSPTTQRT